MKKAVISVLIFFTAVSFLLYLQRNSRPALLCTTLDDSIRPRNYCLMNPFRNKQPEKTAEEILRELKNDNTEAIIPYLSDDQKNHFPENESKYKVENWRIGEREDAEDKISLLYWVSRRDYMPEHLEEVSFFFVRDGNQWKLENFSAIY